jgi:hypothetical protein
MRTLRAILCVCVLASTAAQSQIVLEPDNYASGTVLNHVLPEVSLITAASNNLPHPPRGFDITAASSTFPFQPPTGTNVFAHVGVPFFYTDRRLRMDFNGLVSDLAIDFQGGSQGIAEQGTLQVFDSSGSMIDSFTTAPLLGGAIQTMAINRPTADVAWAVAYTLTDESPFGRLDHLSFSTPLPVPEPAPLVIGLMALIAFARVGSPFFGPSKRNESPSEDSQRSQSGSQR